MTLSEESSNKATLAPSHYERKSKSSEGSEEKRGSGSMYPSSIDVGIRTKKRSDSSCFIFQ